MSTFLFSILAIEMSGRTGSFCFLQEPEEAGQVVEFEHPLRATGPAFSLLGSLLQERGNPDIVAVGLGPGSYNGLRVAVAIAEGLRTATGARLVGRSSFVGLPPGQIFVVGDARSGQFFTAVFENGKALLEPQLCADVNAVMKCRETFPEANACRIGECQAFAHWPATRPHAQLLARRVAADLRAGIEPHEPPGVLEPIYLKPPHITAPRSRRQAGPQISAAS
jgi:tRNA threonylcarbamoyladenosine biosynthesis protein TsaB